jgi:hypothetical protein
MQRAAFVRAGVGIAAYGADSAPIGALAVANRKPIERSQFWAPMIEISARRAAAEIERARAEGGGRINASSSRGAGRAALEEANRYFESYSWFDLARPAPAAERTSLVSLTGAAGCRGARPRGDWSRGEIRPTPCAWRQMIESLLRLSRAGRGVPGARRTLTRRRGRLGAARPVGERPARRRRSGAARGERRPGARRQVWANLISNAPSIRATRRAAIEIGGAQGRASRVHGADNGIGFDAPRRAPVRAFQRLPTAASRSRAAASASPSSSASCAATAARSGAESPGRRHLHFTPPASAPSAARRSLLRPGASRPLQCL